MGKYTSTASVGRGTTLNSLKEELCALNRRLLLAMQNHDEEEQQVIRTQAASVQTEIDRMSFSRKM